VNIHNINMVIKNLRVFRCNSLNVLRIGELTRYDESTLTPVSGSEGIARMLEFRI
jgi:hypothetical protein